ncbi:MAG: YigZ family protein [Pseudomonadota bacterium]|nr:YigZ family protein [Pseudomonadota bacterium]
MTLGYPIPKQRLRTMIEIRKSRFITTLAPITDAEQVQALLSDIRQEFPDASHHCWAFLIGAPKSSANVGMSDDGEPKGTAGRPMLTVLLHAEIGDVMVVVTRYFGGTKLGTGGLMRAYSDCVKDILTHVETTQRVDYSSIQLRLDYPDFDPLQRLLTQLEAQGLHADYTEHILVQFELPVAHQAQLHDYLARHPQITDLSAAIPLAAVKTPLQN